MASYLAHLLHPLSRNAWTVLVLFFLANIAHSWRPYVLKLHSPTYASWAPDTLDFNTTIDENSEISLYLNIKRDLPNSFMHVTYLFSDYDGNFNMASTNRTINFCTFLTNRKIDVVLRILFAVGEKFGQLPTNCPIKKFQYRNVVLSDSSAEMTWSKYHNEI